MLHLYFVKVMPQLKFDGDIIEVLEGMSFKLSSRQFKLPYTESQRGLISPRIFHDFKIRSNCDGGYFGSSVLDCFPDVAERTRFLNKFYQCLLAGQLPLKTRKLMVVGPSDSGSIYIYIYTCMYLDMEKYK